MRLIEKKYEKVNVRVTGVDPLGNTVYAWDWKQSYVYNTKAIVALMAMILVTIGSVAAAIIVTMGGEKNIPAATSVVVEEASTTEMVQKYTYGPAYVKADKYVCDAAVTSNEYSLVTVEVDRGVITYVDWQEMADRTVVFEWNAGDVMFAAFEEAVADFIQYTRADIRVVYGDYTPLNGEYVIPVDLNDTMPQAMAWVSQAWDTTNYRYGLSNEISVVETYMRISPATQDAAMEYGWHNLFLHEIGHVYGLGHTHEEDGVQIDSIMSYEADIVSHYLPGDIAGLKEVFC